MIRHCNKDTTSSSTLHRHHHSKIEEHADAIFSRDDLISLEIASHDVVIYSKSYCPFCTRTKNLFKTQFPNVKAKILELDKIVYGEAMLTALKDMTGQRTVPNVFVKGKHIGGNDKTHQAFEDGTLQQLLA
ncbi:hypothetical protein CTEN210_07606 [Chaetoceros tenuissimus]|uniref:Glutaredoxin domain-containing protein n=1 Tax=Chaetoceros tenuissimus TaxID=426638 RepID=A0AAD3CU68_9STRA|nr:hypothetical protein CTEN210_07606 [Chaetoceros tenuissimus]